MRELAKSFFAEAEKIRNRRSIWVRLYNGKWTHIYNPLLVNQKIETLEEEGRRLLGDYYENK